MNRRSFLKTIVALAGTAAVPAALVEACAIDAPVPNSWIIGLLDADGIEVASASVTELSTRIFFPTFTGTHVLTHAFVEGGEFDKRHVFPLTLSQVCVCAGDTIYLTTNITTEYV